MNNLFTAMSSHGEVIARCDTGEVIAVERYDCRDPDGDCISRIIKFDVAKFREHNPAWSLNGASIDILSIGYWSRNADGTVYELPALMEATHG